MSTRESVEYSRSFWAERNGLYRFFIERYRTKRVRIRLAAARSKSAEMNEVSIILNVSKVRISLSYKTGPWFLSRDTRKNQKTMGMNVQKEGTSHRGEKPEPAANLALVTALSVEFKRLVSEQKAGLLNV